MQPVGNLKSIFIPGLEPTSGAVSSPAWSPSSLFAASEEGAWYDPSDLSTLFQDDDGTTPVTADGDPVGLMQDKSGNGNHATQATTSKRPTYKTDGTLHWLEFDGIDDYLATSFVHEAVGSIYAADKNPLAASAADVVYGGRSASSLRAYLTKDSGIVSGGIGSSTNATIKGGGDQRGISTVVSIDYDGANVNLYLDGVSVYTAAQNGSTTPGIAGFIGALNNLGSPVSYYQGDMFGIVPINKVLGPEDRALLEGYLATKSGVVL